jgi:8-oxo-dGTP pyrophosphatase MutT (NUDIX family)
VKKHFTATAFVVRGDATLLHWHKRLGQWMPPGGHVEPDEEPAEAALREVLEETGLVCEVVPTAEQHAFRTPHEIPAPYTILLEDIPGPPPSEAPQRRHRVGAAHQHIDLIYFVRPIEDAGQVDVGDPTLRWVTEAELRENGPLDVAGCGTSASLKDDVRELALAAIAWVRRVSG